jgi:lysophospholipase L1-like esterase
MKRLVFLLTACLVSGCTASDVPLEPYIGGRVVPHVIETPSADSHFSISHVFLDATKPSAYTYAWPGVYFEAQFEGNTVDIKVDDDQNNLYLYIDNVHKLTLTRPGRFTVALKDLGAGHHVVRLEKASETQSSTGSFDGFYVGSSDDALPAPQYDRRIEFIGDSFTVGYGNTSRGQVCTVQDVADTTDTSQSFAPAAAKYFHAAYRINAYSGRGIVRNYNGIEPGVTLPVLYKYALFDHTTPAQDDGWTPDVIVIGLGTNDFSTPLNPGETWKTREALRADFTSNYAAFVKSLHVRWPGAHIILMASNSYGSEILDAANATVASLKADGVTDLEVIAFTNLDYQACHGHPSLKDEAILSRLLIDRIALLPKFR